MAFPCLSGCGTSVTAPGLICAECTAHPRDYKPKGRRRNKGTVPNASKMLDDQIRALRTIQKQLERTLYDTDARGKPINTYYDPAIASGWMQISDKIIKAAAEKRLWLEAKVREAGDLTAVEQAEIATEFLVSSRAPIEAKKRALERIQASLSSIVVLREVK